MRQISESRFRILLVTLAALGFWFWASSLSFTPMPWPDDSAFFLPGIEWINSPSRYRMHAQAPFVPSYDQANFNTMPGMPLLLGVGNWIGISTSHSIRFFGIAAFVAYAVLLALWMRKKGFTLATTSVLALAALLSPAIRWGAMVVRPEIWQGLFWLLILLDLDGFYKKASAWRIPALLALGAYFHFDAIVWVIPTALAVFLNSWIRGESPTQALGRLAGVGWRTVLFLTPWLVYLLTHWDLFWTQMHIQFGRLEESHPYITSLHSFFHSIFMHLGAPVDYPKFFNLGKGITWSLLLGGTFYLTLEAVRELRRRQPAATTGTWLASVAAILTTLYLWVTKPETWYTTLIHVALWPMVVLVFSRLKNTRTRQVMTGLVAVLAVLQAAMALDQWRRTRDSYTWDGFTAWIDCIEKAVGERKRVWQPHWPDVLTNLAGRNPDRDYYRAVDFQGIEPLLEKHVASQEAIVHTLGFTASAKEWHSVYEGAPRDLDLYFVTEYPWIPFKNYSAPHLKGGWKFTICHQGPFWAGISLK